MAQVVDGSACNIKKGPRRGASEMVGTVIDVYLWPPRAMKPQVDWDLNKVLQFCFVLFPFEGGARGFLALV